MSAIAIVAIVVGGTLAYIATAIYVFLRLTWYLGQRQVYDPAFSAGLLVVFLPIGLVLFAFYAFVPIDRKGGLAPRAVRREQKLKLQRDEISRLERELELLS